MAQESKLITADVVQANEFPHLSQMYGVRAVPKTIINRMLDVLGAVPEESFLEQVLKVGVKSEPPDAPPRLGRGKKE